MHMLEFEYARSALINGLKLEAQLGTNPYKFGLIGSTDAHTGLVAVEEDIPLVGATALSTGLVLPRARALCLVCDDAVAPAALGLVQGAIGLLEELLGVAGIDREGGDAG